jgi:glucose/arabinose dehydrogenase
MNRRSLLRAAAAGGATALVAACSSGGSKGLGPTTLPGGPTASTGGSGGPLPTPDELATGLDVPWGFAFLPGGDALIPERDSGRILRLHPGSQPTEIMRIEEAVATGEGGLLGLAVSPTFASDGQLFAYYTAADDNRIVRFRLGEAQTVLVRGIAKGSIHDGGRLAFGPDGLLYATTGDAGDRTHSQDLGSLNGKILRLQPDGTPPPTNPFPGSLVYSYGHRNVQGLAWDPQGRLWSAEFGQDAWDELNLIEPGRDYGWPIVEGIGDTQGGRLTNPVRVWRPAEASPSGLAYWRGALYLPALRGQRLWRVPVDASGTTGTPEPLLVGTYGRLRAAAVAPDGSLWLATNNTDGRGSPRPGDDRVLRFAPR